MHLNGYKIANPTVLGRMCDEEIRELFRGCGHEPLFVDGTDPTLMHRTMADALDVAFASIRSTQSTAVCPFHSEVTGSMMMRPRPTRSIARNLVKCDSGGWDHDLLVNEFARQLDGAADRACPHCQSELLA